MPAAEGRQVVVSDGAPATLGAPFEAIVCNSLLLGEALLALLCGLRRLVTARGRLLIQILHSLCTSMNLTRWLAHGGLRWLRRRDAGADAVVFPHLRRLGRPAGLRRLALQALQALEEPRAAPLAVPVFMGFVATPADAV